MAIHEPQNTWFRKNEDLLNKQYATDHSTDSIQFQDEPCVCVRPNAATGIFDASCFLE